MQIEQLTLQGVRNLAPLELAPRARFHVFAGDNGQGKTNLLETIFVVAALRSFRTTTLADLIGFGQPFARVSAQVRTGGLTRLYQLQLQPSGRRVLLDGKSPRPLARYFGGFNVVLFAPEDLQLPRGAPADRRRFLDRAVFNLHPEYLQAATDYDRVLRSRNATLRQVHEAKLSHAAAHGMLDVYDAQLADLGHQVATFRGRYLEALRPGFARAFEHIGRTGAQGELWHGRLDDDGTLIAPLPTVADRQAEMGQRRARDLARGTTSYGPHRDDLLFRFAGHPAGGFASQGQLRAMILAWKTAELELITTVRGEAPILLLDDVSSELDPHRNAYLFEHLAERAGQCFITTTHPAHVIVQDGRQDYRVRAGAIERA